MAALRGQAFPVPTEFAQVVQCFGYLRAVWMRWCFLIVLVVGSGKSP